MRGTTEESRFDSREGREIFFFLKTPGLFLGSTSLFSRQQGVIPRGYSVRVVNLATHIHLVSRYIMRGVIPELHHAPSRRPHVTCRLTPTFSDTDIRVLDQVNVWAFKLRRCKMLVKQDSSTLALSQFTDWRLDVLAHTKCFVIHLRRKILRYFLRFTHRP